MAKEQMKVVLIETFKGEKYLLTLDREYERALMNLLKRLLRMLLWVHLLIYLFVR